METRLHAQLEAASRPSFTPVSGGLLQRRCACGGTLGPTGECAEFEKKRKPFLQRKLMIGASNDPLEHEADRVADQVMAGPTSPAVNDTPLRIQRFTGQPAGQTDAVPASVDQVLSSAGRPLEPPLRQDMEQRFGHHFMQVRVHANAAAATSAHHIGAHAYTAGSDIVFGSGRFAPGTNEGRRLLAHELTHVVQQTGSPTELISRGGIVQRDRSEFSPILEPKDLFMAYFGEMFAGKFDGIADRLFLAFTIHPSPAGYLQDVFEAASDQISQYEDDIGAAFIRRMNEDRLDALASSYHGRYALSLIYQAIITGDPTEFEREQANRVLFAKTRQYSPDDFARRSRVRDNGRPTRIFPVRFMRVTGGDYAPPLARLLENGQVRVSYPQSVSSMPTFKNEIRTIANFIGHGDVISANEIVIIKDYERGTETPLPALALIDYSNQAIHSTFGKIVEVSIFAATLGVGSGAAAGAEATAETAAVRFTSTAIWGARIAKAARVLDVAANVIGVAAFVVDENREWIIKKLGPAGRMLVRISDIANTAVAIYGVVRLAHAGFHVAKEFHSAASKARAGARDLTNAEASIIEEVDNKLTQLSNEIDEQAAKTGQVASPAKQETAVGVHADEAASTRMGKDATVKPAKQSAADLDEIHASATLHKIPQQELEHQADILARDAGDPNNVRVPERGKVDAEMQADGHRFERNQQSRTWCRYTQKDCELELGRQVNTNVDAAVAAKRARRQQEIAEEFEAAQRGIKREPGYRKDDPKWSKQVEIIEENAQFGRLNETYLRTALKKKLAANFDDVADQVRIRPNLANGQPAEFYFIADHLARTPQTHGFIVIEGKLKPSAMMSANQTSGYDLLAHNGGQVISRNAPHYPHGTKLPPTPGVRAEPTINLQTTARPQGQDVDFRLDPIE